MNIFRTSVPSTTTYSQVSGGATGEISQSMLSLNFRYLSLVPFWVLYRLLHPRSVTIDTIRGEYR